MSEIRAGVVLKSRFIIPGEVFSNYINYMDKRSKKLEIITYINSAYIMIIWEIPKKRQGYFVQKKII